MKTFEEFTKHIPIELDSSKDNKNLKAEIDKKISEKMKKQQIKKIRKIQKSMNKYLNGDSSF